MAGLPITNIIHEINNVNTKNVCVLHQFHDNNLGEITEFPQTFYNLAPGIYSFSINGIEYAFDLFYYIEDFDKLVIENEYKAYFIYLDKKYSIILYKIENKLNTLNTSIQLGTGNDRLLFPNEIFGFIAYEGYSQLSSEIQENTSGRFANINKYTIGNYKNLYNETKLYLYYNNSYNGSSIDYPLKNSIKNINNVYRDTLILNQAQNYAHVIYRVGSKVLSGNENWVYLEDYSTDDSWLYYMKDKSMKIENSTNLLSTYFTVYTASEIISDNTKFGIALGNSKEYQGILLRIPKIPFDSNAILYENEDGELIPDLLILLKKYLINLLQTEYPLRINFPLKEEKYTMISIDTGIRYLSTKYPTNNSYTNITVSSYNNKNIIVSLGYKKLR
jgi:hypothetical protein